MRDTYHREENRQAEIKKLVAEGKIPNEVELQRNPDISVQSRAWLMGKVAGSINVSASVPQAKNRMAG